MVNKELLKDLKILDFSMRLPGPYSTFILKTLGANVLKLENSDYGLDPFAAAENKGRTPHFLDWYRNLNQNKTIENLSFTTSKDKVRDYINEADIIFYPENRFFDDFLREFKSESCKAWIAIAGGKEEHKNIHDLNALALTSVFKDHLKEQCAPPFLPLAGMMFGSFLATSALACSRKVERDGKSHTETLYLSEISPKLLDVLKSQQTDIPSKFLHNGRFPCYQVYETKDSAYVCLAAVEDKYWKRFCELFNLDQEVYLAYDSSSQTSNFLKNMFANLNSDEITKKMNNESICLSILS